MQPIPPIKENQNGAAFDSNISTPYVQNFTLSVTRRLTPKVDLDVRYIGTRGLKLTGSYNLNVPSVFNNPVLMDAFTRTRRGEDVELFDQMFLGLNLNPGVANFSAVNGTTQRGSAHLRQSTTFRRLSPTGISTRWPPSWITSTVQVPVLPDSLLRSQDKPVSAAEFCDGRTRVSTCPAVLLSAGPVVPAGLFPENWISSNPQFNQANYYSDSGSSVYHSLQVQGTLRPTHGVSFQGTYLWSRSLGISPSSYTNPAEREKDYILQGTPSHP